MKGSVTMKKGFLLLAIGLWTIVVATIIIIAIFISNGSAYNMMKSETAVKKEEILLGDAKNIIIESSRQSIEIFKTNGDKIKVSQYGRPDTSNDQLFLVSVSDGSIRIYIDKSINTIFSMNTYRERLVVEIPKEYYDDLNATATSGSIKIEDEFELKNIKLNTSSGSILATMNIKTDGYMSLNASSGSINIDNDITAKDLYANTSSGSIRMSNIYVDRYDLRSTSGSIKINGISGEGNANATSGSIRLTLDNPKGDINVNTSSGSIKIDLEPKVQFTLIAQTSSGSIKANFPLEKNERGNYATANIGNNPGININAKASSGGIRVEN